MKPGDEGVRRPVVQHPGRIALLQAAVLQHCDAVAEGHRLRLIVRDVHGRRAEPGLQLGDVRAHLHAELGVQVRQRLVHQEHARLADDRATHGNPLPLSTGELTRLPLEELGELEQVGDIAHARLALRLRDLGELEREADVGGDGQVRVEGVVLKHHRDVAILRREVRDVALTDEDRAVVDLFEPREHPQRSRLAGARRPDEDDELTLLDVQVERVHGRRRRPGVGTGRLHVPNVSHHSTST